MRVVQQSIQDGIGQRRIADSFVPLINRQLTGDKRGPCAMAIFHDLQQVITLSQRQGF